jgi:hypothetical protein
MNFDAWPIVQVTAPPLVTDEGLRAHLDEFEAEVRARGGGAAVLLDLRVCERLSVAQRRMLSERMERNDEAGLARSCAMVFESRLLRGILTAMFWVYRPRYSTRTFANHRDAFEWSQMMVQGAKPGHEARLGSLAPASEAADSENFERQPQPGSWIVHVDASRSRNVAAEMVGALRSTDRDAYLCEKKLNADLSLWLGWLGPFARRDEAFKARDDLARRGVLLTVSQWATNTG